MFRVQWEGSGQATRLLTHDQLIGQLEDLAERDFVDAPPGPLVLEEIDPKSRTRWRGYYTGADMLRALLAQLQAERLMTGARGARTSKPRT